MFGFISRFNNGNWSWTERSAIWSEIICNFKIERARSASSVWDQKYDCRQKLHDTRFNYHFYLLHPFVNNTIFFVNINIHLSTSGKPALFWKRGNLQLGNRNCKTFPLKWLFSTYMSLQSKWLVYVSHEIWLVTIISVSFCSAKKECDLQQKKWCDSWTSHTVENQSDCKNQGNFCNPKEIRVLRSICCFFSFIWPADNWTEVLNLVKIDGWPWNYLDRLAFAVTK